MQNDTSNREIILTRVINAPHELVFKVWTDPEHVAKWWGPNGFTNTIKEMDVKTGGEWSFTMHGPDGTDYPNKVIYNEVVYPERLVYRHGDDNHVHFFDVTVTFEDLEGKTRLTMTSVFPTAEARNYVIENHKAIEGGNQTINKLEEYLSNL